MLGKSLAFAVGALLCAGTAAAAENPFYGTWKSNLEKSHMTNPALINRPMLVVIAPCSENGWTRVQINVTNLLQSGNEEHYCAKFDGKDYPTNGGDPRHIALIRVDERTVDTVIKRNGTVTSRQRMVVSTDGKTLTSTGGGVNGRGERYEGQVQVFDRQE